MMIKELIKDFDTIFEVHKSKEHIIQQKSLNYLPKQGDVITIICDETEQLTIHSYSFFENYIRVNYLDKYDFTETFEFYIKIDDVQYLIDKSIDEKLIEWNIDTLMKKFEL